MSNFNNATVSSSQTGFLPVPTGPFVISSTAQADGVELSLVLPTFKESKNIASALDIVSSVLRGAENLRFEIIVVDDNSPDGTAQIALDKSVKIPEVRVMCRTAESGLATAVIRGWQTARGQILAVMDADLQHPPEVLAKLVAAMRGGADLATASRHVDDGGVGTWNIFRRIVSRAAQFIGLIILPEVVGRISDPMSGYFMVRRESIAGKTLNPTGYKILIEVLGRGKISKISEVGYIFQERQEGESKVTNTIYLQYLQHLLRLRLARFSRS